MFILTVLFLYFFRRSPISVAAAAIYMASQASEEKRSQKGANNRLSCPPQTVIGFSTALITVERDLSYQYIIIR